jgi:hypothetical protein
MVALNRLPRSKLFEGLFLVGVGVVPHGHPRRKNDSTRGSHAENGRAQDRPGDQTNEGHCGMRGGGVESGLN